MDEHARQQLRERQRAITAAIHTVGWPMGIVILGLASYEVSRVATYDERSVATYLGLLVVVLGVAAGLIILVGTATGVITHRLFSESDIPVKRMSIAMGLVVDFAIIGWLVVAVYS